MCRVSIPTNITWINKGLAGLPNRSMATKGTALIDRLFLCIDFKNYVNKNPIHTDIVQFSHGEFDLVNRAINFVLSNLCSELLH